LRGRCFSALFMSLRGTGDLSARIACYFAAADRCLVARAWRYKRSRLNFSLVRRQQRRPKLS
jgi:hypothetical protein